MKQTRLITFVRWMLLALLTVEFLFVAVGFLGAGDAGLAFLAVEVTLVAYVATQTVDLARRYRQARRQGADRPSAVMATIDAELPRPLAVVLRGELATWRALWFLARRRRDVPEGAVAIPYSTGAGATIAAVLMLTAVELFVFHLLIPWPAARWALTALGVAGFLWLAGFLGGLACYPHTVDRGWLRLRYSTLLDLRVPLSLVDAAAPVRTPRDQRRTAEVRDGVLAIAVSGLTNVRVQLREGFDPRLRGRSAEVREVHFLALDASAAAGAVQAFRAASPEPPA